MKQALILLIVAALAGLSTGVEAAPGNPVFGTVRFGPSLKHTDIALLAQFDTVSDRDGQRDVKGTSLSHFEVAQGFKPLYTDDIGSAFLYLKKVGNPTDNLQVSLYLDDGTGKPTGTAVVSSSPVSGSTVSSVDFAWVRFQLTAPYPATAGTRYHVALKRTGTADGTNYYQWGVDASSPAYADGSVSHRSTAAGAWTGVSGEDALFQVFSPSTSINIYLDDFRIPACTILCGLGGYQVAVVYDSTLMKNVTLTNGTFLGSTGNTNYILCQPSFSPAPNVVELDCSTLSPPNNGPTGSGHLATLTFDPVVPGTTPLNITDCPMGALPNCVLLTNITGQYQGIVPLQKNGTVVIADYPWTGDTDLDGCTDQKEIGSIAATGGWRNPTDAYDFYDVPSPTLHDLGQLSNRDKVVNAADGTAASKDWLAVRKYAGTYDGGPPNTANVDYDDDKNNDGLDDGLAYDRSAGPDWSGAPDGAINVIEDAMLVTAQNGHDCKP